MDSNRVRVERIPLRVRDGEGLLSTNTYELVVSVRPMDTLSPLVTKNTGVYPYYCVMIREKLKSVARVLG